MAIIARMGERAKYFITLAVGFIIIVAVSAFSYSLGIRSKNEAKSQKSAPAIVYITKAPERETSTNSADSEFDLSPTPESLTKSVILISDAQKDGFRNSNSTGDNKAEIRIGRNDSFVTRGFLSFGLTKIPEGAEIENASLRIYKTNTTGSPSVAGGEIWVDHVTYGDSLDKTDYALPALISNFGSLQKDINPDWFSVDVTDLVREDLANARSESQFRLHYKRELKGESEEGDFTHFESGDNHVGTGNLPQLLVKYH